MAKDPEERWQSAADVKAELKWIAGAGRPTEVAKADPPNRTVKVLAAACVLLMAALVLAIFLLPKPFAPAVEVRASIPAPEKTDFLLMDDDAAGPVVISPDGTNIAFPARDDQGRPRLWVRALMEAANGFLTGEWLTSALPPSSGKGRFADEPAVTELQPTIPRLLRPISQMFLLGFDEIVGTVTLFRWRSRQQSTGGAV